ncbi:hypothetical protein PJ261_05600 [Streptococcus dysgalactiae]
MKISDIADLLTASGAFLVGLASLIRAVKKEPKQKRQARKFK